MTQLESKIEKIKLLLLQADKELNKIDSEGFDIIFPKVKKLLQESKVNKSYLLKNYSLTQLTSYNKELTDLTKQIKKSFDDIIEKKRKEMDRISFEMKSIQNRKKLVNYIR